MNKSLKIVAGIVLALAAIVALFSTVMTVAFSDHFGKGEKRFVICRDNSLVKVSPLQAEVGDRIIIYDDAVSLGTVVTVTGFDDDRFICVDDNGEESEISYDDGAAVAKVEKIYPHLGGMLRFMKSPLGYILCILVPCLLLIAALCFILIRNFKKARSSREIAADIPGEVPDLLLGASDNVFSDALPLTPYDTAKNRADQPPLIIQDPFPAQAEQDISKDLPDFGMGFNFNRPESVPEMAETIDFVIDQDPAKEKDLPDDTDDTPKLADTSDVTDTPEMSDTPDTPEKDDIPGKDIPETVDEKQQSAPGPSETWSDLAMALEVLGMSPAVIPDAAGPVAAVTAGTPEELPALGLDEIPAEDNSDHTASELGSDDLFEWLNGVEIAESGSEPVPTAEVPEETTDTVEYVPFPADPDRTIVFVSADPSESEQSSDPTVGTDLPDSEYENGDLFAWLNGVEISESGSEPVSDGPEETIITEEYVLPPVDQEPPFVFGSADPSGSNQETDPVDVSADLPGSEYENGDLFSWLSQVEITDSEHRSVTVPETATDSEPDTLPVSDTVSGTFDDDLSGTAVHNEPEQEIYDDNIAAAEASDPVLSETDDGDVWNALQMAILGASLSSDDAADSETVSDPVTDEDAESDIVDDITEWNDVSEEDMPDDTVSADPETQGTVENDIWEELVLAVDAAIASDEETDEKPVVLPDVPDVENIALSYLSGEAKEFSQDTDSENRPALLSGSEFERLLWEGVDDMLAGRDIMQPDVISDVLQPEGSDDSVSAEEYGDGSVPANDGQLTDAASLFEKIDLLDKE